MEYMLYPPSEHNMRFAILSADGSIAKTLFKFYRAICCRTSAAICF